MVLPGMRKRPIESFGVIKNPNFVRELSERISYSEIQKLFKNTNRILDIVTVFVIFKNSVQN